MAKFIDRIIHAWNVFRNNDDASNRIVTYNGGGVSYSTRPPDRTRLRYSNERSILASILTRLSIDVASVDIRHARLDENGRYSEDIQSGLNSCLTLEANLDQGARHFRQDIAMTLVDRGVLAIVPIDTSVSPISSGGYDIQTMRVGEIVAWEPDRVQVNVYNEATGTRETVPVPKRVAAIVENPFYTVMNEHNSTLQRLIRKLNLLDVIDEQSSSGKLDIIIQLPYAIKSETVRQRAEQRRIDMESQLSGSKYGIAYSDATEKIVQLNRPAENNLLEQVDYLTKMLYTQLGLTPEIMNGTADEAAMLNYMNRMIEPIVAAIVEAMRRTFLTKTARTQKQSIVYFRDPFKFVPMEKLGEIADSFIRNQIATSNDMRQVVGWKPVKDPKADQLNNPNMPEEKSQAPSEPNPPTKPGKEDAPDGGS